MQLISIVTAGLLTSGLIGAAAAAPTAYQGELAPGVLATGAFVAVNDGFADQHQYFSLSGLAGQEIDVRAQSADSAFRVNLKLSVGHRFNDNAFYALGASVYPSYSDPPRVFRLLQRQSSSLLHLHGKSLRSAQNG